MKAVLNPDGTFSHLVDNATAAITDPTRLRDWVPTVPDVGPDQVAEQTSPLIDDTTATQQWTVRNKTDGEAQKVASQLTLWLLLSNAERRALRSMANSEGPAGDTALQLEGALFSAVETESRNPQTKAILGAAIQLGIVADVERAREILGDPGFTLA